MRLLLRGQPPFKQILPLVRVLSEVVELFDPLTAQQLETIVAHGVVRIRNARKTSGEYVRINPVTPGGRTRLCEVREKAHRIQTDVLWNRFGGVHFGHIENCREQIHRIDQRFRNAALIDAGSRHDQGHIDATLVNRPLGAPRLEWRRDGTA